LFFKQIKTIEMKKILVVLLIFSISFWSCNNDEEQVDNENVENQVTEDVQIEDIRKLMINRNRKIVRNPNWILILRNL